jgi:putative ABC transport system permease protein
MSGGNLAHECQSDAAPLPLGREEGHEYLLALIRRNAWVTTHVIISSPEFPPLYGMRLLAGRLLSTAHGEDVFSSYPFYPQTPDVDAGHNVLINREAARRFGYTPDEAVGKTLVAGSGGHVTIAGVLGDSKLDGVRESVLPAVYGDFP